MVVGLGLGNIWWALGWRRCCACCSSCGQLVIDTHDGVRKGCTVRNLKQVLNILRTYAPDAAVLANNNRFPNRNDDDEDDDEDDVQPKSSPLITFHDTSDFPYTDDDDDDDDHRDDDDDQHENDEPPSAF
jgi:hypothetical protein